MKEEDRIGSFTRVYLAQNNPLSDHKLTVEGEK